MPDREQESLGENSGSGQAGDGQGTELENLCERVEAFVAQKPLQALAIAFLTGIVVSKIVL